MTFEPSDSNRVAAGMGADDWISALASMERDGDTFVAREPGSWRERLFGGLVAAQALAAAGMTVGGDKIPHSLHIYFLRAGAPGVDVAFEVDAPRRGRSFDTRRVTARQDEQAIAEMIASFHRAEPGADHHPPAPSVVSPDDPDALPIETPWDDHFEIRTASAGYQRRVGFTEVPLWIRARRPVPADPTLRACVLTYLSDIGLLSATRPPDVPPEAGRRSAASLDHSVWFHRPFDPQRWHCYHGHTLTNSGGRGLAHGSLFDDAGILVATTSQEALWRP